MKKLLLLFLLLPLFLSNPYRVFAQSESTKYPTATVINPLRGPQLGLENVDLLASLKGQWQITKEVGIPATWMWQYSALEEEALVTFAKKEMFEQEFGLFLEVDKNTAEKAGVQYKGKGPWYHSDGLFLVSYDQYERRKIIDLTFKKFKDTFGYYPKSVGAWWVGADAINYMHQKYGITAVLECADQFATDEYSLWGTPWSIPYIPSKENAAIPAQNVMDTYNNVVIMQWAPRDPLRAYGDSVEESIYSVQDMKIAGQGYYTYLVDIFLNKPFDQTVVGLEGGAPPDAYQVNYKMQLETLKKLEKEKKLTIQTSENYAAAYLAHKTILPPTKYFLTKDYLTSDQSFWYHSPSYRIGIHKIKDKVYLVDFRDYQNTPSEAFSVLPNIHRQIRIHTTPIVDSILRPNEKVTLATVSKPLFLEEKNKAVLLKSGSEVLATFYPNQVTFAPLKNNPLHKTTFFPYTHINSPLALIALFLSFYLLLLTISITKQKEFFIACITFLVLLVLSIPLLSSGNVLSDVYFFDERFLWLFNLSPYLPTDLNTKITIVHQVLPLFVLMCIHFITVKKIKNKLAQLTLFAVYGLILIIINTTLLEDYLLFFQQGKKYMLMAGSIALFAMGTVYGMYLLYKKKHYSLYLLLLATLFIGIFISQYKHIYSEKKLVITPFETEALTEVLKSQKDIVYLLPPPHPSVISYPSVKPLLFTKEREAELLTGKDWQQKIAENGKQLNFEDRKKLILVPTYQEVNLSDADKKGYKFKKIFDNMLMQVYE